MSNKSFVIVGIGMALICLIPLAMVHVGWLIEAWPRTSDMLCKGEDCTVQGWATALGGWVAIAAAWITLKALRHQVAETNRHQRENLELQIWNRINLAGAVRDNCGITRAQLEAIHQEERAELKVDIIIASRIKVARASVAVDLLDRFSKEIGLHDRTSIVAITQALERAEERLRNGGPADGYIARDVDEYALLLSSDLEIATVNLSQIENDATTFINRWEPRINSDG